MHEEKEQIVKISYLTKGAKYTDQYHPGEILEYQGNFTTKRILPTKGNTVIISPGRRVDLYKE